MTRYQTLIDVAALKALLGSGEAVFVLDCRFDLATPDAGRLAFEAGHIPAARYAHLNEDLSSPGDGTNGRHPLPARVTLAAWLCTQGLRHGQQVIAYDASGGMFAARAWWLLRWLGYEAVAVLDGGLEAWREAGLPLESGPAIAAMPGDFAPGEPLVPTPVGAAQVLDARDPARFAGAPNPLDPVPGHIPGARNRFFRDNLDAQGRFRSADDLAQAFTGLGADGPTILQCGSGVTACHNALAMAVAGLPAGRLYPGSWSEWIADPTRPVAKGA